jgi:hypothetical protein
MLFRAGEELFKSLPSHFVEPGDVLKDLNLHGFL